MRASAPSAEQLAHVVHEVRLRLRVALLVARARAEHEQPLGARGADVEEVALAVEPVLAHRQHEPARGGDRAAVVVREERLGGGAAGELALLKPAREHHLEAARADGLRRGHLHAVGLRALAHVHLELLQHAQHPCARRRGWRAEHGAQLGERLLRRARSARASSSCGPLSTAARALVGGGEQASRGGSPARLTKAAVVARARAQPVELLERPVVALPAARAPAAAAVRALAGAPRPRAGRRGPARCSRPGRAEVGEQVVGRARRARRSGSARAGRARGPVCAERQRAVDRVRDAVGAEDLLEQRRVARRVAEHDRHVARATTSAPRSSSSTRAAASSTSARSPPAEWKEIALAGIDPRGRLVLEQQPLDVVERRARLRRVVVVDRRRARARSAPSPSRSWWRVAHRPERPTSRLVRQRDGHVGVAARDASRARRAEAGEVVEPVDEHRRVAPGRRVRPQRVECAPARTAPRPRVRRPRGPSR